MLHLITGTRKGGQLVNIDRAATREDGTTVGAWSGETLEEIGARYDNVRVVTIEEFCKLDAEQWRRPVREITRDEFYEMLEVLPPEDWHRDENGSQSFKLAEYTSGSITNIYATRAGRFYMLADDFTTPHAEIMRRVREFAK